MQCFRAKFLNAILAKQREPQPSSFGDRFRGESLRDRHQLDFAARAAGVSANRADRLFQPFEILAQCSHRALIRKALQIPANSKSPGFGRGYNLKMWTIVLLTISNIFMTFAWYGHLRFRHEALWKVILVSWGIAFFEYCFQVPANRIGADRFSPVQLKVIQEVITLVVFGVFVTYYFGEHLRWNHAVSAIFLIGAVFFAFHQF